ncbi:N-acyl-phosphatidylethanolamine-hydrolyzing phospholipase D [Seminavis robusta]|uniref:N-acyl-phosphatidylethanolamine-hydrolyzing phospholipase D n=1 Tax=Seminavis robusta TaxID=568900 RepID=A0A9N8DV79_9STRA|nr:N-acyl-phosphatidylethanolamine-hydrolyzing phospholipase D [Seminavis robusta]|eukprot:Sro395_g134150.1 N-acyl-phosphatidylethanolamine-hydrolyzing phospholipase D (391) ;mRNA; r:53601-54773
MTKTKAAPTSRSRAEIAALVQQRVNEREAWLVDGEPQGKKSLLKEANQFVGDVAPKLALFRPPSQAFLDEHFPVQYFDYEKWEQLRHPPLEKIQVTWMSHASVLFQIQGCSVLADPVFSQRCAPTQWNGPKRYRSPPCTIAELCHHLLIDVVIISHNHYDHLDFASVRDIHKFSPATTFVVPLGLKLWFHKKISKHALVQELDWNEHYDYNYNPAGSSAIGATRQSLRITSVPMRHWSSRLGVDRDKTLWCGYSMATHSDDDDDQKAPTAVPTQKALFPGDTAWFDSMQELVGEAYGPFDVAAIPIGAYEPRGFMKHNHINVEEAVKMMDACRAVNAVPIHWGTFPLTIEPVLEPRERLESLMKDRVAPGSFGSWLIGETKQFSAGRGAV